MRSQLNVFQWDMTCEVEHTAAKTLLGGKGKPQVDELRAWCTDVGISWWESYPNHNGRDGRNNGKDKDPRIILRLNVGKRVLWIHQRFILWVKGKILVSMVINQWRDSLFAVKIKFNFRVDEIKVIVWYLSKHVQWTKDMRVYIRKEILLETGKNIVMRISDIAERESKTQKTVSQEST